MSKVPPALPLLPDELSVAPCIFSPERRMESSSTSISPVGAVVLDGVVAGAAGVAAAVEAGSDADDALWEAGEICCARFWNRLTRSAKAVGEKDWMRLATWSKAWMSCWLRPRLCKMVLSV